MRCGFALISPTQQHLQIALQVALVHRIVHWHTPADRNRHLQRHCPLFCRRTGPEATCHPVTQERWFILLRHRRFHLVLHGFRRVLRSGFARYDIVRFRQVHLDLSRRAILAILVPGRSFLHLFKTPCLFHLPLRLGNVRLSLRMDRIPVHRWIVGFFRFHFRDSFPGLRLRPMIHRWLGWRRQYLRLHIEGFANSHGQRLVLSRQPRQRSDPGCQLVQRLCIRLTPWSGPPVRPFQQAAQTVFHVHRHIGPVTLRTQPVGQVQRQSSVIRGFRLLRNHLFLHRLTGHPLWMIGRGDLFPILPHRCRLLLAQGLDLPGISHGPRPATRPIRNPPDLQRHSGNLFIGGMHTGQDLVQHPAPTATRPPPVFLPLLLFSLPSLFRCFRPVLRIGQILHRHRINPLRHQLFHLAMHPRHLRALAVEHQPSLEEHGYRLFPQRPRHQRATCKDARRGQQPPCPVHTGFPTRQLIGLGGQTRWHPLQQPPPVPRIAQSPHVAFHRQPIPTH